MSHLPTTLPPSLQRFSFLEPLPVHEIVQNASQHPSPSNSSPSSPGLYCSACKKSFSSQNTWNSHLTSQRHLRAAKKSDSPAVSSPPSKSPSKNQLSRADTAQLIAQATAWKAEAEQRAKTTPVKACNLLLRAAKSFLQASQVHDAGLCYELILTTQKARVTDWSCEALMRDGRLDVLVHTRIHLARLYFPFVRELAVEHACTAVQYFFGASAQVADDETLAMLQSRAVNLIDQLVLIVSRMKGNNESGGEGGGATTTTTTTPNVEEAIVSRASNVLGEASDILSVSGPLHLEKAILFMLLAAQCSNSDARARALRQCSQLYQQTTKPWYAIDCLLQAASSTRESSANDLAEALYLCVLHDDRVRMQRTFAVLPRDSIPTLLLRVANAANEFSMLMLEEAVIDEPAQAADPRMTHLIKKVRMRLL